MFIAMDANYTIAKFVLNNIAKPIYHKTIFRVD